DHTRSGGHGRLKWTAAKQRKWHQANREIAAIDAELKRVEPKPTLKPKRPTDRSLKGSDPVLVQARRRTMHEVRDDGTAACGNSNGGKGSYEAMTRSQAQADPRSRPCQSLGCVAARLGMPTAHVHAENAASEENDLAFTLSAGRQPRKASFWKDAE